MENKTKAILIIVLIIVGTLPWGILLLTKGKLTRDGATPAPRALQQQAGENVNPAAKNTASPYHLETAPPFVDDPAVVGEWKSVDFVRQKDDFKPERQLWTGDLFLKSMVFLPGGRTGGPWQWSKGMVWHPGDKSRAGYDIKEIGGARYLFFEWISGDVLIRGEAPRYYVLKFVG